MFSMNFKVLYSVEDLLKILHPYTCLKRNFSVLCVFFFLLLITHSGSIMIIYDVFFLSYVLNCNILEQQLVISLEKMIVEV